MTREELDALWFQAMRQSIEAGEDFIRYHFAALVAERERETCAIAGGAAAMAGLDHLQVAAAIRARGET